MVVLGIMEPNANSAVADGNTTPRSAPPPRRVFFRLVWILAGGLALGSSLIPAQAQVSREYQLKAVCLFNFAQFVEWPTNAFVSTNSPIIIGLLGVDPFGSFLDETVQGETIHGRRVVVERYRRVEEATSCHILYIAQSETRGLERITSALADKPVLSVSDIEDSARHGAMIEFVIQNNKIKLRVNLSVVTPARLTLSSKLLRVADLILAEKKS